MPLNLAARASTWWAKWKIVFWLVLALAGSAWLNVHQWKKAITAPLRAENAGLREAADTSADLLADAHARADLLADASERAAANLTEASDDYRGAARARPITDPRCAPGSGRQDAVNRALGAQPPE